MKRRRMSFVPSFRAILTRFDFRSFLQLRKSESNSRRRRYQVEPLESRYMLDGAPIFGAGPFDFDGSQDLLAGDLIGTVDATDNSGSVYYSLYQDINGNSNSFSINGDGEIRVASDGALLDWAVNDIIALQVEAADMDGNLATADVTIEVQPAANPPAFDPNSLTMHVAEDTQGYVGTVIASDNGGSVYYSLPNPGGLFSIDSTGAITVSSGSLVGASGQSFTFPVAASDMLGIVSTANVTVNVNVNTTPTPTPTVTLSPVNEGTTKTYTFHNPAQAASVTIQWGDGTTYVHNNSNPTFVAPHTYEDDDPTTTPSDNYTMIVNYSNGFTGSYIVPVNNVAPTISMSATGTTLNEGGDVSVTFVYDDQGRQDTLNLTIDWGDCTIETFANVAFPQSYTRSHEYDDDDGDDTYTITATVTDDDGGIATDTMNVTVANVAPTATDVSVATTEDETIQINLQSIVVDPGADTFTYNVDSSDTDGTVTVMGNGIFAYDPSGEFDDLLDGQNRTDSFSFTVSDDDGGTSSTYTVTVTVNGERSCTTRLVEPEGPIGAITEFYLIDEDGFFSSLAAWGGVGINDNGFAMALTGLARANYILFPSDGFHAITAVVSIIAIDKKDGQCEIDYKELGGAEWNYHNSPLTLGMQANIRTIGSDGDTITVDFRGTAGVKGGGAVGAGIGQNLTAGLTIPDASIQIETSLRTSTTWKAYRIEDAPPSTPISD